MNLIKLYVLIVLLCTINLIGFGLGSEVDSLETLLINKNGVERVKILADIALLYEQSSPDISQKYANQGLQQLINIEDDSLKVILFNSLGRSSSVLKDYQDAINFFDEALILSEKRRDSSFIAMTRNNLGLAHRKLDNYAEALEHHKIALLIRKRLGDKVAIGTSLNNLGSIYYYQKDHKKALDYFEQALDIFEVIDDLEKTLQIVNNMSQILFEIKDFDKALYYNIQALNVSKQMKNSIGIAMAYVNIASIYKRTKNYERATDYFNEAAQTFLNAGMLVDFAKVNYELGNVLNLRRRYDDAINFLKVSILVSDSLKLGSLMASNFLTMSQVYFAQGHHKSAYEVLNLHAELIDSLKAETRVSLMAELESKYEIDLKRREIDFLKQNSKIQELKIERNKARDANQRNIIISLSIGALLIAMLFLFLLKQNKKMNDINDQLQDKNIAITDSIEYASYIQNAILPNLDILSNYFQQHFVLNMPKDIVSGDLYYIEECNHKLIVAAIDCTGHGVPGAIMSILANNSLSNTIIGKRIIDPAKILTQLNNEVRASLKRSGEDKLRDGMEIAICTFDKHSKAKEGEIIVEFASANRPLFVVKQREHKEIKTDTCVIGGFTEDNYEFKKVVLELDRNDAIYMFSDGTTDQFGGENHRKYTKARLYSLLSSNAALELSIQKNSLVQDIQEWQGSDKQTDDILVIGLKV